MVTSEEHCTLRNTNVIAYHNLIKIVNPTILTNPTVVTNNEIPGRLDNHVVLYHQTLANLCAKRTEKRHLDAHERVPRGTYY